MAPCSGNPGQRRGQICGMPGSGGLVLPFRKKPGKSLICQGSTGCVHQRYEKSWSRRDAETSPQDAGAPHTLRPCSLYISLWQLARVVAPPSKK